MRTFIIGLIVILYTLLSMPTAAWGVAATPTVTPTLDAAGIDLTHLPLGDTLHSTSPKVGYIWPCHVDTNSRAGAGVDGPWIDKADGTYDLTAKDIVHGSVEWPAHHLEITLVGDKRVISTNDLPDHFTGIFPIAQADSAYRYDRNPNRITQQQFHVELPANLTLAAQPSCAPGAVGVLLSGVSLFSALDAPGRDAVAHELQDGCQGHPEISGIYHYHSLSNCVPDQVDSDGHSALIGYALDGFGIFGRHGENGKILTSADLDECHGHTHAIEWDGKIVVMYHYHATWDFPYTIGCMRGTVNMADVMTISGGTVQTGPAQGSGGGQPNGQPDLAAAAQKLGITEQQLRDALGPPPPNLAVAARKLGITEQQLRDALGLP
jgi:hypothetical protein